MSRQRRSRPGAALRVMHSAASTAGVTSFPELIGHPAGAGTSTIVPFSWKRAFLLDYDVLHLHWPEHLLRARSGWKRQLKGVALRCLVQMSRWTGRPVIRTLHNVQPHESVGALETAHLAFVESRTDAFIALNRWTPSPAPSRTRVIPHPHYMTAFGGYPRQDPLPGRILYFGAIRDYKGVDRLIEAFQGVAGSDVSLRLVGRPTSTWRSRIEQAVRVDERVSARLEMVSDADLVSEITQASLVVLPYTEMHNSGVAFAALSAGRPILVPVTPVNDDLRAEVGEGWVSRFEGPITASDVAAALLSGIPDGAPNLSARDPRDMSVLHDELYRAEGRSRRR